MRYSKKVKLINKLGIHLKAAAAFVMTAEKFKSEIKVKYNNIEADGKSIMSVLGLGAPFKSEIEIIANGADAKEAIFGLEKLIKEKFGEEK
ncbi:MAG: HPr family phosphocarrier protein [Candidatus Goldbacteria bacterium]|nr:HPr family phosphocarrier protein [Candidatus Goldiibacteriota bacterium]HPD18135.1 HPr family phosphocarrier protein [Candidatus Goldiibacteriota bacterium]